MVEILIQYLKILFTKKLIYLKAQTYLSLQVYEDNIVYFEFGETPPNGSQYQMAPFVEAFIKTVINSVQYNDVMKLLIYAKGLIKKLSNI